MQAILCTQKRTLRVNYIILQNSNYVNFEFFSVLASAGSVLVCNRFLVDGDSYLW